MWPLQGAPLLSQALPKVAPRAGWDASTLRRWASLSAIHQGRRREERSRPQGFRSSRQGTRDSGATETSQPLTFAERRRARAAAPAPTFRIRKGKKDITHKDGPRAMSRQARFYDPKDSFGKKSLVYQAKAGNLKEQFGALDDKSTMPRRPLRSPARPEPASSSYSRRDTPRRWENGRADDSEGRRSDRTGAAARSEDRRGRNERPIRSRQGREHRRDDVPGYGGATRRDEPFQTAVAERQPLSIPYTTAASQFLYGKSVVEAALQASQRKLYKLYIYGGANRQNVSQDIGIQRQAERKGVDVQIVGEDGLRLMEKMSAGRPHNGYVLEASPLPQLPLTSLGPMSEDENNPGFHVNMAHQSVEDAKINGSSDFFPSPRNSNYKPLVLVLDQILDPGNFGAILRTASFLGATAVAVTKRNSASLTPVALKASAGASEALTLFSVESLAPFLTESKENGWQVYAAVPGAARSRQHRQVDMHELADLDPLSKDPCILLMGSEGDGLSRQLRSKADVVVNIPNLSGSNVVDSLNVSVATGLLCSAFLRGKERSQFSKLAEKSEEPGLW
ncbi:hypothetical protein QBC33DRAFT_444666 [Phialemonium atrogriseum]|uniref:rRNA methyltransferase 1, mitochondrial n=1 Tax=Phialemonium atrogriseum TaxID=1093897 RepID=A0AAJ0FQA3_9PEZI|nr:uncharacterized protein QBC33DRAFT_444666 [Phialemonium atrogriseum]KAK1771088.1 hypothetical protein QBC33DRAFT_444666 [Phialemonium atrogriseum]